MRSRSFSIQSICTTTAYSVLHIIVYVWIYVLYSHSPTNSGRDSALSRNQQQKNTRFLRPIISRWHDACSLPTKIPDRTLQQRTAFNENSLTPTTALVSSWPLTARCTNRKRARRTLATCNALDLKRVCQSASDERRPQRWLCTICIALDKENVFCTYVGSHTIMGGEKPTRRYDVHDVVVYVVWVCCAVSQLRVARRVQLLYISHKTHSRLNTRWKHTCDKPEEAKRVSE